MPGVVMHAVCRSALANVGKHAGARRAGVTLSYMDDEVSLDVRDDGRGFGLGGMRARAERVAGGVVIESEPGLGTALSVRVPLVRHD